MVDTFWLNDPTILLNKDHISEVIPQGNTLSSKLNSVTRLVIIMTVVGFALTRSYRVLVSSVLTLCAIVAIYKIKKREIIKKTIDKRLFKEGFTNPQLYKKNQQKYTNPTKKNPFMNVLLPEIKYNPKRNAAAPSFDPKVEKKINESAGNVGIDPRLFLDLGDSINFEQSMQRFYTTANSRVGNDQTAFAKFCYGDMPSCKDDNGLQCLKSNPRWTNH
tara:strand:- start:5199 stop:5852 length:654 start_codon:yes stop_codon:yes gene_type:complete